MARFRNPLAASEVAKTGRRVSVIVPARNEEANLPGLLGSLHAQDPPPYEVIVVDDGSEDRSAEIALAHGARIVRPGVPPEGWRGKTWACQCGAQEAGGDLLCFLDADTRVAVPDGMGRMVAAHPGGAFSVLPWHTVGSACEHLSLFFNLNMAFGTLGRGLFGPVLLIDRAEHLRCGGHEAVRGRVLENFHLAACLREAGVPVSSANGRGMISFRMYPGGFRSLREGWEKGFASGAGGTPPLVMAASVSWSTGLLLIPAGLVGSGFAPAWILLQGLALLQLGWLARQVGDFRGWYLPLYPVALLFFFIVFGRSSRRSGRNVSWKGREFRDG